MVIGKFELAFCAIEARIEVRAFAPAFVIACMKASSDEHEQSPTDVQDPVIVSVGTSVEVSSPSMSVLSPQSSRIVPVIVFLNVAR